VRSHDANKICLRYVLDSTESIKLQKDYTEKCIVQISVTTFYTVLPLICMDTNAS